MEWFKKKSDPISDRAQALNDEIAGLEAQIKRLDARLQKNQPPNLRAGLGLDERKSRASEPAPARAVERPAAAEPIFEDMGPKRLNPRPENVTREHYNDLGVRKYDLPALFKRVRDHFRGPSTTNPKLVSYLAAGGIQGLRPLRYEKRVARNRFIALVLILFFTMLGIIAVFVRHR